MEAILLVAQHTSSDHACRTEKVDGPDNLRSRSERTLHLAPNEELVTSFELNSMRRSLHDVDGPNMEPVKVEGGTMHEGHYNDVDHNAPVCGFRDGTAGDGLHLPDVPACELRSTAGVKRRMNERQRNDEERQLLAATALTGLLLRPTQPDAAQDDAPLNSDGSTGQGQPEKKMPKLVPKAPSPRKSSKPGKLGSMGAPNKAPSVCHCCGAVGYYTKTCGKRHECLRAACKGNVPAFIRGEAAGADATQGPVYRVACPMCATENRFVFNARHAELDLQCWYCGNSMTARVSAVKHDPTGVTPDS